MQKPRRDHLQEILNGGCVVEEERGNAQDMESNGEHIN